MLLKSYNTNTSIDLKKVLFFIGFEHHALGELVTCK